MGKPAARVTDLHTCPMVTVLVPHVGGPIIPPCSKDTIIGYLPAARVTDKATCVGPPDVIAQGSPTVLINYLQAARMGDMTMHGGVIVTGFFPVLIGESGSGGAGGMGVGSAMLAADAASEKPKEEGKPGAPPKSDAEKMDEKVLDKFGKQIPESKKSPSASSVADYQSDKDFKEGIQKRWPGLKNVDSIHGESYRSKIFINKDKDKGGTFTHESIHHYSSDAFQSKFYNVHGVNLNEGVTELYTRQIHSEDRDGHYSAERAWAKRVEKEVGVDTLQKAYFGGDKDAITKVSAAMDKLNAPPPKAK